MPCLEMTVPELSNDIKEKLAKRLTEVFTETTPFEAEIFGICFHEYERSSVYLGGKSCNNDNERPYLHFLFYSPRLKRTVKQKLVERMSSAFTEIIGKPNWYPVIHLNEHPYDNVGVDGKLLSDSYEACAESKFYYELPSD